MESKRSYQVLIGDEQNLSNKEKNRLYAKNWRLRNPEKTKLSLQTYAKNHPEKLLESRKKSYQKHKLIRLQKNKIWRENNPTKVKFNTFKHRDIKLTRAKQKRGKIRSWYEDIKKNLGCKLCTETHPACLDFHHRDPKTKLFSIANAARSKGGWSRDQILEEINKCEVICSNCHRKLHYEESKLKNISIGA